jgi:hypothetical protein
VPRTGLIKGLLTSPTVFTGSATSAGYGVRAAPVAKALSEQTGHVRLDLLGRGELIPGGGGPQLLVGRPIAERAGERGRDLEGGELDEAHRVRGAMAYLDAIEEVRRVQHGLQRERGVALSASYRFQLAPSTVTSGA